MVLLGSLRDWGLFNSESIILRVPKENQTKKFILSVEALVAKVEMDLIIKKNDMDSCMLVWKILCESLITCKILPQQDLASI